jgi:hypothetical protein
MSVHSLQWHANRETLWDRCAAKPNPYNPGDRAPFRARIVGRVDMWRRMVFLLATILVGACQGGGTPTTTPTQAVTPTVAPTAVIEATPSPEPTKPETLPRISDLPLDGSCEAPDISCFGILEAGKVYQSKVFTPTLSFTVPNGDWVNPGEVGGDFALLSTRDVGDEIIFFRDAKSFDKSESTVSGITTWLQSQGSLTLTDPKPATIGGLTGVSMDLRIAPGATTADPGCPVRVCLLLLRGDDPVLNDPYQWHWDWGSAGTEVQRLYLLEGKDTTIAIFVDSRDGLTFDALTHTFEAMIPTIHFK